MSKGHLPPLFTFYLKKDSSLKLGYVPVHHYAEWLKGYSSSLEDEHGG